MSNLEILTNAINEKSEPSGKDFSYIVDNRKQKEKILKECFLSLNDKQKQLIMDYARNLNAIN